MLESTNGKFVLHHGEQKHIFRAEDYASQKEWLEHFRKIIDRRKLSLQHPMANARTWASRDGRRKAMFGKLAKVYACDSEKSIHASTSAVEQTQDQSSCNMSPGGPGHTICADRFPTPWTSNVNKVCVCVLELLDALGSVTCTYVHTYAHKYSM